MASLFTQWLLSHLTLSPGSKSHQIHTHLCCDHSPLLRGHPALCCLTQILLRLIFHYTLCSSYIQLSHHRLTSVPPPLACASFCLSPPSFPWLGKPLPLLEGSIDISLKTFSIQPGSYLFPLPIQL